MLPDPRNHTAYASALIYEDPTPHAHHFTILAMASSIIELAKLILQNVSAYEQYFTTNSLARPTLEASGFPEPNLPGEVTAARNAALEACAELQAILKGPVGIVRGVTALVRKLFLFARYHVFLISSAEHPLDSVASYQRL